MRIPHFSYTQTQEGQVRGEREQRGDVMTLTGRYPLSGAGSLGKAPCAGCWLAAFPWRGSWREAGTARRRGQQRPYCFLWEVSPPGSARLRLVSGTYNQSRPSALRSPKLGREACSGGPPYRPVRTPAGWLPCGPVFTTPGHC